MWAQDDTLTYLKGRGKGNRHHSSGKGYGRRKNPRDRNGNLMSVAIATAKNTLSPVVRKAKAKANP